MDKSNIIPVILCGGSGTRLWPLSRQKTPKQFLKFLGDETLLQKTAMRTCNIISPECHDVVVVTLDDMAEETSEQLKNANGECSFHILREPKAKNTASSVALAMQYIEDKFDDDKYVWVLPADHYIGDEAALSDALAQAYQAAGNDCLVTFGIKPTRAETGYGYIKKAEAIDGGATYSVEGFYEKPDQNVADKFYKSGEYLWSSGMHLFKNSFAKKMYTRHASDIWRNVKKSKSHSWNNVPDFAIFDQSREEPYETAIMEHADCIAVIACDPEWSDVGSWESLWEINQKDDAGNTTEGEVYSEGTKNSMIVAKDRIVTCLGMEDVIVIETEDSVLVANKQCGKSLKNVVNILKANARKETMQHGSKEYAWGKERVILNSKSSLIKEYVLRSEHSISMDSQSRNGELYVAEGSAIIKNRNSFLKVTEGEIIKMNGDDNYEILNLNATKLRLYKILTDETQKIRDFKVSDRIANDLTAVISNQENEKVSTIFSHKEMVS
jgi:mannose-1-phosphate guanylyltransferase/mannose-6-phosphate isomerase